LIDNSSPPFYDTGQSPVSSPPSWSPAPTPAPNTPTSNSNNTATIGLRSSASSSFSAPDHAASSTIPEAKRRKIKEEEPSEPALLGIKVETTRVDDEEERRADLGRKFDWDMMFAEFRSHDPQNYKALEDAIRVIEAKIGS
jgi:hypothetical protein